jgi:hypothetical protein
MASGPLYLTLLAGPVLPVPVPKPVTDAFVAAEVTESATGRTGFQLTFTLADSSVLQTLFLLAGDSPVPVLRVALVVTWGGLPQVLFDGVIEHHEVKPDAMSGSAKLVVTGHDLSVLMDLTDLTGQVPYPGLSPDQRVEVILARYAAFGIVPLVIPVPAPDVPVPQQRVPVHRGTDLGYIRKLAAEAGYIFCLVPGPVPGTTTAYFGPQVRVGVPQQALSVNMDAWTNVETLSFTYQPQGAVTPVVYLASPGAGVPPVPVAIPPVTPFNPPLGAVVPPPQHVRYLRGTAKRSPAEALMLGMAEVVRHADVVTGQGTLSVDRYGQVLRPRSLVGVRGAGIAFDGLHYVDSVTHTLKPGDYKQSFVLKRNALITNLPAVPALPY